MKIEIPYKPLKSHLPFHFDSRRVRLLRGGVGAGKTTAGAAEAMRLAIENPQYDGMIVAPTWSVLFRTSLRAFKNMIPKELFTTESKKERYIELVNASRIYYGSADRPETIEGADLAWAWADELRYWKKEAWQILIARVRSPGAPLPSIVATSTPRKHWMFDEFANRRDRLDLVVPTTANSYLSPEYLKTLKSSYSDSLYSQDVDGEWVDVSGSSFPEFSISKNVQKGLAEDARGREVVLAFDPGIRKSSAVILEKLSFCSRHGTTDCVHVLDELLLENTPTYRAVHDISVWLSKRGWQVGTTVLDPAASARSTQTGVPDARLFQEAGFQVKRPTTKIQRDIISGVNAIKAALAPVSGLPRLYFDEDLYHGTDTKHRGIVNAIQRIESDEEGKTIKDGHYEHSLDAFRYGFVVLCPPVTLTPYTL